MALCEINLIEMAFRRWQFERMSIESLMDTILANIESIFDLAVNLEPVLAEIAFGLFSIYKPFLHLLLILFVRKRQYILIFKSFIFLSEITYQFFIFLHRKLYSLKDSSGIELFETLTSFKTLNLFIPFGISLRQLSERFKISRDVFYT